MLRLLTAPGRPFTGAQLQAALDRFELGRLLIWGFENRRGRTPAPGKTFRQ